MVKKSKVNKCLTKKKASPSAAPLNPFEVHHTKSKHSVLGVKEKRIGGMPGVSRSRALEKVFILVGRIIFPFRLIEGFSGYDSLLSHVSHVTCHMSRVMWYDKVKRNTPIINYDSLLAASQHSGS